MRIESIGYKTCPAPRGMEVVQLYEHHAVNYQTDVLIN